MGWLGKLVGGGLGLAAGAPGAIAGGILGGKAEDKFNEGQAGVNAANVLENNPGIKALLEEARLSGDPKLIQAIQAYGQGQIPLSQALSASSNPGLAARVLVSDPVAGTKYATEQVQNNPLLSGMFGEGGFQDRIQAEEKDLASRGWTLQPEDHEAYGQASDEVARLSAQEEGSLARALASRGLATGASGAAGVGFSGLQGNKFERLAEAQRQIATDRMEMNRQRLEGVRNTMLQTSNAARGAINEQFGRNRDGVADQRGVMADAVKAGQVQQGQNNVEFNQQQETQGPSLGEILGTAAGAAGGAYLGGPKGAQIGSTVGSALGSTSGKRR